MILNEIYFIFNLSFFYYSIPLWVQELLKATTQKVELTILSLKKIPAIPISIKGCKLFDIAQNPYIELYILYFVSCQLHLLICKNLNYKCNSICWSLHRHIGLLVHLDIAVSFYIYIFRFISNTILYVFLIEISLLFCS